MSLIFWVIVIGAIVYFLVIKKNNNRKAAQNGEDKKRLHKATESLPARGGDYQVLYAHREDRSSSGRRVTTTYYRYVITYQDQTLCVAPLSIDKKTREIRVGQPSLFSPENLGKIAITAKQKNGLTNHIELTLFDKQGNQLKQVCVDAENLRKSRWYPVNIIQQDECSAFESFITSLAQCIASENPNVDAIIKANENEGTGILGAIIAVIGAVFAIFLPPLGFLVALIGLIMAAVSKAKGNKSNKSLIISIICTIWSIAFLVIILQYYF